MKKQIETINKILVNHVDTETNLNKGYIVSDKEKTYLRTLSADHMEYIEIETDIYKNVKEQSIIKDNKTLKLIPLREPVKQINIEYDKPTIIKIKNFNTFKKDLYKLSTFKEPMKLAVTNTKNNDFEAYTDTIQIDKNNYYNGLELHYYFKNATKTQTETEPKPQKYYIHRIYNSLKGINCKIKDITIIYKYQHPLTIKLTSDNMTITYIIAPKIM